MNTPLLLERLKKVGWHHTANQLDGIRISHSAGALSPSGLTREELIWLIQGAGRIPVERDTHYNEIKVF